jgi:hypothetical protein
MVAMVARVARVALAVPGGGSREVRGERRKDALPVARVCRVHGSCRQPTPSQA